MMDVRRRIISSYRRVAIGSERKTPFRTRFARRVRKADKRAAARMIEEETRWYDPFEAEDIEPYYAVLDDCMVG
jgi:hypothetical protein